VFACLGKAERYKADVIYQLVLIRFSSVHRRKTRSTKNKTPKRSNRTPNRSNETSKENNRRTNKGNKTT